MPSIPSPGFAAVRLLPKRALTLGAGRAAAVRIPVALRRGIYGVFARAVGADVQEAELPLERYPTFNDFFSRRLRDGARPWAASGALGAPADGRLDASGHVEAGRLIQAKGIDYALSDLLADVGLAARLEGGAYATVYLSPADYHRVHAPTSLRVDRVRHIGGELWPVNGLSVPFVDGLFRRNERVVFSFETEDGIPGALVMIGATVVGAITVANTEVSFVHRHDRTSDEHVFSSPWRVAAGGELGAFLLGSTVVLVVGTADRGWELAPTAASGGPTVVGSPLFVPT